MEAEVKPSNNTNNTTNNPNNNPNSDRNNNNNNNHNELLPSLGSLVPPLSLASSIPVRNSSAAASTSLVNSSNSIPMTNSSTTVPSSLANSSASVPIQPAANLLSSLPDVKFGVEPTSKTISVPFDPSDPRLKQEIIQLILQYLKNENYTAAAMALQDEAKTKQVDENSNKKRASRMKQAILDGDWPEVEKLCTKKFFKHQSSFLYATYKQQYLELLEKQEYQKAYTYLTKRLKPLETQQTYSEEFKDLCYLLTCRSVHDLPAFRTWENDISSREALVRQFESLLDFDTTEIASEVPPNRLVSLLRQAIDYQFEFSKYHPTNPPKVKSLFEDYKCFVVPNVTKATFVGHNSNVKCISFVGDEAKLLASGSSDNTVKIWNSADGSLYHSVSAHASRIWSIASSNSGNILCTASGDASIKVWDVKGTKIEEKGIIKSHEGDVYSVTVHPTSQNHICSGGYDKSVRLFDLRTYTLLKTFASHTAPVSTTIFNPQGNLIISGSKDCTMKFWDITSGLCTKTYSTHLGEVTSVSTNAAGNLILSASKDNSNRLWDIRTSKPVKRFKGHQNTSKNFVRACFGPSEAIVISGSEDGWIYMWDVGTGNIVHKVQGHTGPAYSVLWSEKQSLLASCGHDNIIKSYWFDPAKPFPAMPFPTNNAA